MTHAPQRQTASTWGFYSLYAGFGDGIDGSPFQNFQNAPLIVCYAPLPAAVAIAYDRRRRAERTRGVGHAPIKPA